MTAAPPTDAPRRVLVVTLGRSGAVVTETLWALARDDRAAWPVELRLIATGDAHALLDAELRAKVKELADELGLPPPQTVFRVARAPDGAAIADIRTREDAIAFADLVIAEVRDLTAEDDVQLHMSLAGGRKTMSYHAGEAMMIYARAQDRLSHVLVNPAEFESAAGFWWPSQKQQQVQGRAGALTAADARIDIAELPFPRLRAALPPDARELAMSHAEIVRLAEEAAKRDRLVLTLATASVSVGEITGHLEPNLFALYYLLAERAKNGAPPVSPKDFQSPFQDPLRRQREIFNAIRLPRIEATYEKMLERDQEYRQRPDILKGDIGIEELYSNNVSTYFTGLQASLRKLFRQPEMYERFTVHKKSHGGARFLALRPDEIELRP